MIVIIDYGIGNLGSIANMLKKVGAHAVISSDTTVIERGEKLILPGVGAFDNGMRNLNERGLTPLLNHLVIDKKIPLLGLCLGMQLLSQHSDEGQLQGLGWIEAETVRFKFDKEQTQLKIPHMGWNTLEVSRPHPLVADLDAGSRFYFVHSYHVVCAQPETSLAWTEYGYTFTSVISKENIMGVQFHPEKSHKHGMKLLKNYAELV